MNMSTNMKPESRRPLIDPSLLRLATVTSVNLENYTCTLKMRDLGSSIRTNVTLPQPYLGFGWGLLVGVEEGTECVVGFNQSKSPIILAFLPPSGTRKSGLFTLLGKGIQYDRYERRHIKPGDIVIQSRGNSIVGAMRNGDVILEAADGSAIEIDKETGTIAQKSLQRYTISEAGRSISGVTMRRKEESTLDPNLAFSSAWGYSYNLDNRIICEDPTKDFDPTENRALTEHRLEVTEFADSINPSIDEVTGEDIAEDNIIASLVIGTVVNEAGEALDLDGNALTSKEDIAKKAVCTMMELKSGWKINVNKEGETKIALPAGEEGQSLTFAADGKVKLSMTELSVVADMIYLGSEEGGDFIIRNVDFPEFTCVVTGARVNKITGAMAWDNQSEKVKSE